MKKALAAILATLLISSCAMSAYAAAQPPRRTVYIASQAAPKAAEEFVRGWFSTRTPAQDICDQTGLTVEQVKEVRICPAFTVEPLETEAAKGYYFPLIYEGTFVATLLVRQGSSGYVCNIFSDGSGDPLLKALNTLSSSASSPMLLAVTKNGYFALDSDNNATLLKTFSPISGREVARQKRAVQNMERPLKAVAISADTVYPEQVSDEQVVDDAPVLAVKNETTGASYASDNGGKVWKYRYPSVTPPVYVSVGMPSFLIKDGKIRYAVHNRTSSKIYADEDFLLKKWNGHEWADCPETDNMFFNNTRTDINPKSAREFEVFWQKQGAGLEAGKYKLIKKLQANNQEFTCEVVFCLV